jgi:hypothetical protein
MIGNTNLITFYGTITEVIYDVAPRDGIWSMQIFMIFFHVQKLNNRLTCTWKLPTDGRSYKSG